MSKTKKHNKQDSSMFESTSTRAFEINELLKEARRINDRLEHLGSTSQHANMISKKKCEQLYPYCNGEDGEYVFELMKMLRNRKITESVILACKCNLPLAFELATICHGNGKLIDATIATFAGDAKKTVQVLKYFKGSGDRSHSNRSPCDLFLEILQIFEGNGEKVVEFILKFDNDGGYALIFIKKFKETEKAIAFVAKFDNKGLIAGQFLKKFEGDSEKAADFLFRFHDNVGNANTLLVGFTENGIEAYDFLSKFTDGDKALSFQNMFKGNGKQAYTFLSNFSNNVEAAETMLSFFNNNGEKAEQFLREFNNDPTQANLFLTKCENNGEKAAKLLSIFEGNTNKANDFLALCNDKGDLAILFLERFQERTEQASRFLKPFAKDMTKAETEFNEIFTKYENKEAFASAISGCNGDIFSANAFVDLSGIKSLALVYDSQKPDAESHSCFDEFHTRCGEFHAHCDGLGPTVTFICSNENVVCGVTESSWVYANRYVSDSSAYLLRLSTNPQKFPIRPESSQYALKCSCSLGPCFGGGIDLETGFSSDPNDPNGLFGCVRQNFSFSLPQNEFLFPTSDGKRYSINRIVVCSFAAKADESNSTKGEPETK